MENYQMNHLIVYNYIRSILVKEIGLERQNICYKSHLGIDLGLSHSDLNILLFFIETRFNVDLADKISLNSTPQHIANEVVLREVFGHELCKEFLLLFR